jgi:nucleoside-diphosphate-sugar epimerase
MPKLFCFGYGYTADFLAQALRAQDGWDISGTTRDYEKLNLMQAKGIDAHLFSTHDSLTDPIEALRGTTHVLISTPADDYGDPSFRFHADDLIHIPTLEWIGYLSTTGVYGDRGGDWVDEKSLVQPTSKRGWRRVRAEQQWLELFEKYELPVHIFRLAGIYGPGRSVLDSVRSGMARRINKPGHAFSRIHVEDIVQTLMTSMKKPHSGAIYNLADDYPAPSHEVIAYACEMLGEPLPPLLDYASADLAPITTSFYADNKRVRNDRIKDDLGILLKYPTFHEGLLACRSAEEGNKGTSLPPYWFTEGRDTVAGND